MVASINRKVDRMDPVNTMGSTLASAIPVTTITSQISDMAPFFAIIVAAGFGWFLVKWAIRRMTKAR